MRFWKNKWNIPNTNWSICGYSRSAYRTGFYVSELDTMLDAGPQNFNKPSSIFVTHGHLDHIAEIHLTAKIDVDNQTDCSTIYGPPELESRILDYFNAGNALNFCKDVNMEGDYKYRPCKKGDKFEVRLNNNPYDIEVFECDHSVPTVSYGLSIVKHKLKEEFFGTPGKEIAKMRKDGVEITNRVSTPTVAYVCDTSIKVFDMNPTLLNYKTIIIECTFLSEEHTDRADDRMHISWASIKPFIEKYKEKHFMLFHFSQQYRLEDLQEFFDKALVGIDNVTPLF